MRRSLQIALLALAALSAALALTATASAKTPCWQTLIDDWYDGRIDSIYPVSCYREALVHMPEDVAQYSSLEDDINRALAAAIAAGKSGGSGGSSNGGSSTSGSSGSSTGTFHGGPKVNRSGAVIVATGGRDQDGGPVGQAISSLGPDSADAVPVPLIVLGSLSVLLLALGSAGIVARRLQGRRATTSPGSDS